ncbi:UNVERIFIED_CONTAM: hypothetical protein GTU68_033218 [Idotea baltica]|nr:hypothetical protein [Idotea baltica]
MKDENLQLPAQGIDPESLLAHMQAARTEDTQWQSGKAFCLVYHPGEKYAKPIKEAYNMFFSENALNPSAFPSLRRFESEVVRMTASLFQGDEKVEGTMSSGGTESILLAVRTAREWARAERPEIKSPEVILPASAHPAFMKAMHYFGVTAVLAPVGKDYRVDIQFVREAIGPNTIMLVGSAPSYPHGVVDPIRDLSDLAMENKLLLHVDACIGGYMLPFVRRLGYAVPAFDFSLPGVTSMSADVHKYGYAAKGASVVLYKDADLRKHQFYVYTEWSGGIYASSTLLGTRPGGAIAAAWAAMKVIGMDGYMELAGKAMRATDRIKAAIQEMDGIHLIGDPEMSLLAIGSDSLNVYALGDELNILGWHFDRQQAPASLHFTVSQVHEEIVDEFLTDLATAIGKVKKFSLNKLSIGAQIAAFKGLKAILPNGMFRKLQNSFSGGGISHGRSAAMYGMMGTLSGSGDLSDLIKNVLHGMYTLETGK